METAARVLRQKRPAIIADLGAVYRGAAVGSPPGRKLCSAP
jgi:hypothetical protein